MTAIPDGPSLFRLDGRTAVVTGASGKLGPTWVRALLDAGASVLALDQPGASQSPLIEALLARHGPDRLRVDYANVLDRAALLRARDAAGRLGTATILVNNAGIDAPPVAGGKAHRLTDIPLEIGKEILAVNTLGAFQVAQIFGEPMVRAGRGAIINIGSLYATVAPDPHLYDHIPQDPPFLKPPHYGASKAALLNLTSYLAAAWGPHGVRVNALSPGGVLGGQDDEFRRKFTQRVPLGRMAVHADLAGPLLFLASDASSYVTGVNLLVDGGFTVW